MGVTSKKVLIQDANLRIPQAAGNIANVADRDLWIDSTAGKLAVRIGGVTVLVPLASEIAEAGLTQEQAEDIIAAMFTGDLEDINWTYTDNGAGAGTLGGTIKAGAITYAKIQDLAEARVLGRAAGAGTGSAVELTGAQIRTILGTLDADTLGGQSSAAIQAAVIAAISGGASAAYDTLVEIQALMEADDTQTAGMITATGLRARYFAAAIPDGAPTANVDHNMALANIHDFTYRCFVAATGIQEDYDVTATTLNRVVVTDETGANIAAGRRIFLTVGV